MIDSAERPKGSSRPIDVRAQQIGGVYAKGFLEASEAAGNTETLLAELDWLVTEALDPSPELEAVFASALVSHEEKAALLDRIFGERVSPQLLNFLKVVSKHGRLGVLRAIHAEIQRRHQLLRGRVQVSVTTAAPLSEELSQTLMRYLRSVTPGEPELDVTVDPQLIGGIVLRIGDTVYDGSVARQLEQVREQMIHRSVHEIQSRRDRFRHSDGD